MSTDCSHWGFVLLGFLFFVGVSALPLSLFRFGAIGIFAFSTVLIGTQSIYVTDRSEG